MLRRLLLSFAALPLFPAVAAHDPAALRDAAAQTDTLAWSITEGLTTEVGQRLAATESEARSREWAVARLKALGFANVRIEPFTMPRWDRGAASATVLSPFPQTLAIAALGYSGSTPKAGIDADVVAFDGLAALKAAPAAAIAGKIVYVTHHMAAQQDGGSYGALSPIRTVAPGMAAQKGAAAILIRSIGTDHHRVPHTGVTRFPEGTRSIPAAALSTVDAEQLDRILARGKPVKLHLEVATRLTGRAQSGNVVAEVPGSDPKAGIILIGGHLDSWDLGTGAIDDATGVAITTAAAKRIMDAGQPRRTIRIVWFGAEEVGGFGGDAYAKAHGAEKHMVVAESDFGADRVWSLAVNTGAQGNPMVERLSEVLAPLGITRSHGAAHGGTDVEPTAATGTAVMDLRQDGLRYFDLHHTADDTLDKVDPAQLRQNVAAWTAALAVLANDPVELTPPPATATGE
ncbi:M20/M25/M40 family metallo-hydrolase [uncultured Sphingomonas sp.]|uniref:M20/M25/M40 family metallo-hydrolase n=1 Tax=uncultured Sphingomonas sp. TaxID=158754 RepID=UPI0025FDA066|nr:M20/M25/M40 family metallo-hydrolase [uncultured Sphingomonas sp.]